MSGCSTLNNSLLLNLVTLLGSFSGVVVLSSLFYIKPKFGLDLFKIVLKFSLSCDNYSFRSLVI